MTLTRPRKKRILESAGLRYVAGWLPKDEAAEVDKKLAEAERLIVAALPDGKS